MVKKLISPKKYFNSPKQNYDDLMVAGASSSHHSGLEKHVLTARQNAHIDSLRDQITVCREMYNNELMSKREYKKIESKALNEIIKIVNYSS